MDDQRVFDRGPQPPVAEDPEAIRQYKSERTAWEKKHGTGPVQISVFSSGEAIERDPARYALRLP